MALACPGGDDCDDGDPNRYPGNAEVCDAEGHDEDCDPSTLGDTDSDGDGFISAECCNGDTCGDDCNDGRFDVRPGATEVCNGVDDDCDGVIDGPTAFCPTGVCAASRCRAASWMATFGGDSTAGPIAAFDFARGAVVAADGNIYAAVSLGFMGTIAGTSVPQGTHLVAIAPDGRVEGSQLIEAGPAGIAALVEDPSGEAVAVLASGRQATWYSTVGTGGALETPSIELPDGDRFVAGAASGTHLYAFGDGAAGVFIQRYAWDGTLEVTLSILDSGARYLSGSVSRNGNTVLAVELSAATMLGSTELPAGQVLVVLNSDLEHVHHIALPAATEGVRSAAIDDAGRVVYAVDGAWELLDRGGARIEGGATAGVAYRLVRFDSLGGIVLTGTFSAPFDLGRGPIVPEGPSDGFIQVLAADGRLPLLSQVVGGPGAGLVNQLTIDPFAGVIAMGDFAGPVTFAGTTYAPRASPDVFVARISD